MPALFAILKVSGLILHWLFGLGTKLFTADGRSAVVAGLGPAAIGALCIAGLAAFLIVVKPFAWRAPGAGVMAVAECGKFMSDAENSALRTAAERQRESMQAAALERHQIAAERDMEAENVRRFSALVSELEKKGSTCSSAELVRAYNAGIKK